MFLYIRLFYDFGVMLCTPAVLYQLYNCLTLYQIQIQSIYYFIIVLIITEYSYSSYEFNTACWNIMLHCSVSALELQA